MSTKNKGTSATPVLVTLVIVVGLATPGFSQDSGVVVDVDAPLVVDSLKFSFVPRTDRSAYDGNDPLLLSLALVNQGAEDAAFQDVGYEADIFRIGDVGGVGLDSDVRADVDGVGEGQVSADAIVDPEAGAGQTGAADGSAHPSLNGSKDGNVSVLASVFDPTQPVTGVFTEIHSVSATMAATGVECPVHGNLNAWNFLLGEGDEAVPAPSGEYLLEVRSSTSDGEPVVGRTRFTLNREAGTSTGSVENPTPECPPAPPGEENVVFLDAASVNPGYHVNYWRERWNGAAARAWYYTGTGAPNSVAAGAQTAYQNAFNAWENDVGSYVDFTFTSWCTGCTQRLPYVDDGFSVAGWSSSLPASALGGALCYYNAAPANSPAGAKQIRGCDIAFNGNNPNIVWTTNGAVAGQYDLQNVATHEAGHFIGMGHVGPPSPLSNCVGCIGSNTDNIETMFWSADVNENKKRDLDWGDRSGIRYLYPNRYTAVSPTDTGTRTGVGGTTEGADAAMGFINSATGQPDLVVGWIDGAAGANKIHYKVLWDVSSSTGQAASATTIRTAVDSTATGDRTGVGDFSEGLGMAIGLIDGDTIPDIVFAWADNPAGANKIFYRVGWDLSTSGIPASWSLIRTALSSDVGDATSDVGACLREIRTSVPVKQELVVGWTDNPSGGNNIRYAVGYNLDATTGKAASWSTRQSMPSGWVGDETDGTGLGCLDMDTGGLDYLLAWVDGQPGTNKIMYRVARNVVVSNVASGFAPSWTPTPGAGSDSAKFGPGFGIGADNVGPESQGLGIATGPIDTFESDDVVFVWVDDTAGENTIYYWTEWNGKFGSHP